MRTRLCLSALAIALSGCSVIPQASPENARYSAANTRSAAPAGYANRTGANQQNVASSSRRSQPRTVNTRASSLPQPRNMGAQQCLNQLEAAGVQYNALPDRNLGAGCSNINTVQLLGMPGDRSRVAVSNLGAVTCGVSNAFAGWARFGADRAAQKILGSSLARIETMGSYSCRNVAGTSRRSAHSSGNAIDISAFVLADGRRISVKDGWNGNSEEREFLRAVQRSACRRFGTVLSPNYNAAHADHFHVEGVISGSSYCR